VWLLAQQVGADTSLFVLGIFSDPSRAKAAVAEHTEGGEPLWKAVEWENGWPARHAAMLWSHRGEEIPLEFWIIPFLLNRSEMGDLTIRLPRLRVPLRH
jgi:hypothetical protein